MTLYPTTSTVVTVTIIAIIADAGGAWSLIARTGRIRTKSEDPTPTEVPRPSAAPMYHYVVETRSAPL